MENKLSLELKLGVGSTNVILDLKEHPNPL